MLDREHNLVAWIAHHAARRGAQLAVVDELRRLDYRTLDERCARAASAFAELGVARGDRVALLLGNRSAYLEAIIAAARLGAIAVPINARLTAPEIRPLLDDCEPRLLVHEAGFAEKVDAAAAARIARLACGGDTDAYEAALSAAAPREGIEPSTAEDPNLLMYTSGTTGVPKGALLPHRKTLFNSMNAREFFELSAQDRVLVALPLFHSFGLNILSIPTLFAGGTLFLHDHFDPGRVWRTVGREQIRFFGGVPTMFRALLESLDGASEAGDRASLRFLFTAGAAIPVELIHDFERHGLVLKQGFGQTETSILCCLDADDAVRKAGSVGRPVRHGEVRVVRTASLAKPPEQWEEVDIGEKGEIVVRGPITMLGYWQRPEATAETLRGAWLRTGDLATVDDEGFLTLVGRARHMYITGGENVYPAEVEAAYGQHPSIREIAVVGVPDSRWGETGRAYVVLEPAERLDAEALRRWGGERLARFKLPAEFVAVAALPRTATGKVQKHRLEETTRTEEQPR